MVTKEKNQKKTLLEAYDNSARLYKSFLEEAEHQIKSILQTSGITVNAITSRLKSRDSFIGKLNRKPGKYSTLSDMTDIAGIRIITYYSEDVDKISEIIENEFDIDQENSIDKRESMEPDRFGYCSVHYVVKMSARRLSLTEYQPYKDLKCEIQIRSVLQHAWAEIEHDIGYKSEVTIPKEMRRSFSRIAGLLEIADKEFNNIRASLSLYKNIVQDQIKQKAPLDQEIDAVVLETINNQDGDIKRLINHIQELTGASIERMDDFQARALINEFRWLGIKTVKQLTEMCVKYIDVAIVIADELLKDFKLEYEDNKLANDIGFFYICYAILLSEFCDVDKIHAYLDNSNIGLPHEQYQIANELYELGLRIKRSNE